MRKLQTLFFFDMIFTMLKEIKVQLTRSLVRVLPSKLLSQHAMKPTGWFGKKIVLSLFETANICLCEFMYDLSDLTHDSVVMDMGFGPGQLFPILENRVEKIVGVDFSRDVVNEATKRYKKMIASGKLELVEASVESLPFDDNTFDVIFTANTIYFYPNPLENVKELLRVIKPNGKLILGLGVKEQLENLGLDEDVFTLYTIEESIELLEKAGFTSVEQHLRSEANRDSYCVVGQKVKTK